jgi:small subunit ribosomal protein S9
MQVYNGLGRRKSAVARVYLREGKGNITINGRDLKDYFSSELLHYVVKQPLMVLNVTESFDIRQTSMVVESPDKPRRLGLALPAH